MAHKRAGLLAQIEADLIGGTVPLSLILQNCITLGREAGSDQLRAWAHEELHGYAEADTAADYRRVPAVLMARITNLVGYNGGPVRFDASIFPTHVRDGLRREEIDLDNAILGQGIGELEDMDSQGKEAYTVIPNWAPLIAEMLNRDRIAQNSRVADVYFSVSHASIHSILVRIRTALVELVAELITLTPQDQEVPDKQATDQAVQFVINGDRTTIY